MKVVIIGAGRAGRGVVQVLMAHNHDVAVVDQSADAVRFIEEHYDVGIVKGYGASPKALADAGCATADLVVALTDQDETNLVAAQTAKSLGAARVLARVQGEGWAGLGGGDGVDQGVLGVDEVFHPRVLVAREMARIARSHGALEVLEIAEDRIEVVKVPVSESSRFINKVLSRLNLPKGIKIAAVVRGGELFVPGGADVLVGGDAAWLVGRREAIDEVQEHFTGESVAARICIVGGGVTGAALARMLQSAGAGVMLIEGNPDLAETLAEQLEGVTVVLGDGTDMELMEEHHVGGCDLFAAVTRDEEINLLAGLLARKLGVPRVATVVQRPEFLGIYSQIGIDIVLCPHILAQEQVLRHCRSEQVRSLTVLEGGKAEVIEFTVTDKARIAGQALRDTRLPPGALVCALVKRSGVVIPGGDDRVEPGDVAVVLATPAAFDATAWHFKQGLF